MLNRPTDFQRYAWFIAIMLLAVVLVACSVGPPPLSTLVRSSDLDAYRQQLATNGGNARTAYWAWRSAQTGEPVAQLQDADAAISETENPFSTDDLEMVRRGAMIYQMHCASCHGTNADGLGPAGEQLPGGKDFHNSHIRMAVGMSKSYVADWYSKIMEGVESDEAMADGTPRVMPPMRDVLTREQVWLAVTYLASDAELTDEVAK